MARSVDQGMEPDAGGQTGGQRPATGDRVTESDAIDVETAAAEGEQPQESTGDRATEEDSDWDVEIPSTPKPDKAESDAGYGDDAVGEPMSTEGGQQTAATAEQQTPAGEVSTDGGTSEGSNHADRAAEITQQMHENEETDAETIATLTADTETLQENKMEAEEEQHKAEENIAELETGVAEAVEVTTQGEGVFTARADEDEEQLQPGTDEDVSAEKSTVGDKGTTGGQEAASDRVDEDEEHLEEQKEAADDAEAHNNVKAAEAVEKEPVKETPEPSTGIGEDSLADPDGQNEWPSFDALESALKPLEDPEGQSYQPTPSMLAIDQVTDIGLIQGCAVEPLGADPTAEIAAQDAEALAVDEVDDPTVPVVDIFELITPGG